MLFFSIPNLSFTVFHQYAQYPTTGNHMECHDRRNLGPLF